MTPSATSNLQGLAELAKADLAQRLSISLETITLIEAKGVIWSDSSLGCPQSGSKYAHQTVPGYRLQLGANGVEYNYHTDTTNTVVLCMEDDPASFPITPGEIDDDQPWIPVN
jgi:hypothetical protein